MRSNGVGSDGVGSDGDGSQQRWGAAQLLLDGQDPGPLAVSRLRRNKVLLRALVGVLLVLPLLVVIALVLHDAPSPQHTPDPRVPRARVVLGVVLSGAGLLVNALALWDLLGGRVQRKALGEPLQVLTRTQRQELLRQVRGQAPADPGRLPLARGLAELLLGQRQAPLILGGQLLAQTGLAVLNGRSYQVALAAVMAALFGVVAPLILRETRRARAFLARHPAT